MTANGTRLPALLGLRALRALPGVLGLPALRARPALFVLGVILLLPASATAQVVRGYVVDDSTETGLTDVAVTVLVDSVPVQRVATDARGWFLFELGADSATVQLRGERLGWRTVLSQPLHVAAGDTVSVELWMGVHAIPVAPLYVTARSNLGRSRFRRRMEEWGRGVYFTPETIDSIDPIHPIDVLRGQEKTWLSWRMGQRKAVPAVRTFLGQGCVRFVLDGMEVRGWGPNREVAGGSAFEDTILETLQGRQIVAAEYYRYIAEVPPELRRYAYFRDSGMCGLVVYWTNVGW